MTRAEFLIQSIKTNGFWTAAEIGVAEGATARRVVDECDLDMYLMVEPSMVQDNEALYDVVKEVDVADDDGFSLKPIMLMRMDSVSASKFIADRSLDLVFIDAGHTYRLTALDIQYWTPKVRVGGIICGHDWDPTGNFPGVVQAVEEAFPHYHVVKDTEGDADNNHVWWVRVTEDVADSVDRWAHGEPTTKHIDIKQLFRVDAAHGDDLDKGSIPKGVLLALEGAGAVLSDRATATVETEGIRWLIEDAGAKYFIMRDEHELIVYGITKAGGDTTSIADSVEEFFEPYPLLRGFSRSWPWMTDVNHANPFFSPLYYIICRNLQARNILEIGCEHGYSSYMLASAAKENGGVYYCIERSSTFAEQLKGGLVEEGFPHVVIWADSKDIGEFPWADQLDFVLLDGEHTLEAIQSEFEMIYPKLSLGGCVALHDINAWSAAGFNSLIHNPSYDLEYITFPHNYGLALLRKRRRNWEEVLEKAAQRESHGEPSSGWVYSGVVPADNRVVVISSTIPEIEAHSMEGIPTEKPQRPAEAPETEDKVPETEDKAPEPVLKVVVSPTAVAEGPGALAEEPLDLEQVPANLRKFVQQLTGK